ncbi:hypothetical protein Xoosp14_112 [Xanthomonas phage Xoo-sp14]|nr:hypothetical protein Xoosp14_112 [Xanthomonas phage Xoo-sp14]
MTDLSIEARDIVLGLINQDNDLTLTHEQVTLEPPGAVTPGEPTTAMRVRSKPTFDYSGSVSLSYERLNLQQVIDKAGGMSILTPKDVTFEQFIGSIAELYDINFTTSEIEPVGVFDLSQGYDQLNVQVKAKGGSYAYYGEGVIVAHFDYIPVPVDELVTAAGKVSAAIRTGLYNIFYNAPGGGIPVPG